MTVPFALETTVSVCDGMLAGSGAFAQAGEETLNTNSVAAPATTSRAPRRTTGATVISLPRSAECRLWRRVR